MAKRLICLAGHGDIAAGVASAVTLIMGPSDDLRTAPSYDGDVAALRAVVDDLLDEVGTDGRLVLVTDLLGGSVSNTVLAYQDDPRVTHITGMSLPLVLELVADDPLDADGGVPATFIERIRSMVTPLPLPAAAPSGTTTGEHARAAEEDF